MGNQKQNTHYLKTQANESYFRTRSLHGYRRGEITSWQA